MNKFLLFLSVVVYVECNGQYGQSLSSSSGYPYQDLMKQLYQQQQYQSQQSYRQPISYEQPQSYQPYQQQPPVIVQNEEDAPIKVLFRARSPKIQVEQIREPSERGSVQTMRTDEEPHRLTHEIHRPVIQEIREVIQPYRRVIQEIKPVIEQLQTIVAKGDGRANNGQVAQEGYAQPIQVSGQSYNQDYTQSYDLGNSGNGNKGYGNDNDYQTSRTALLSQLLKQYRSSSS